MKMGPLINTVDFMKMIKKMGLAISFGLMETSIKESFSMIINMVRVR